MENRAPKVVGLSKSVLYLMTAASGLVVANNYYSQPLLSMIGESFQVGEAAVSNVSAATQWGYALGLLVIVPLGDRFATMKILKIDFAILVLALLGAALSPSLSILVLSSFVIGFSATIPQLFVPLAANLAKPENQGRVTGMVMTGLLAGIIGSRILSGAIGAIWGWRSMFYIGAGIVVVLFILLRWKLPPHQPHNRERYGHLMRSILVYFGEEPVLRLAAFRGALAFAGLSAYWTALIFVLRDSFGYASKAAGLFGVFGIIGALGSSVTGRLSDRIDRNKLVFGAIGIILVSWAILYWSAYSLIGLALGAISLDLGVNMMSVTNQNIIFSKLPDARSRVNTGYMFIFFVGGTLGTFIGARAYQHYGWMGVCAFGLLLTVLLAVVQFRYRNIK